MRTKMGPFWVRPNIIFWTAIILLALVSAIAVGSTYRLLGLYEASSRSHQALLELDRYMSNLKDVETGTRGYALTRDPRFLDSYQSGMAALPRRAARLKELAHSEHALALHLEGLLQTADRRTALAKDVIDRANNGASDPLVNVPIVSGEQAMDEARQEVAVIISAQQATYDHRSDVLERQAAVASIALGLGVALSLIALTWLYSMRSREVMRRRNAEAELRTLNAQLEQRVIERASEVEEARQLLDAIIENMPDSVFLKDVGNDFKYKLLNAAGEKLLGLDRGDVIGRPDREIFPEDVATLFRAEDQALVESPDLKLMVERALPTSNGVRQIELCKMPLSQQGDGTKYVLGIAHDVTERRTLETHIREIQRLDSVGRLTGGIAHDFNNLLAVIMGSVELIREKFENGSESAAVADEALGAVRRGADLVRRLLAFARKQHLETSDIDLNDRLPKIVPLLERVLGENIRVQVDSTDDLWLARIDPTQVDDALVNLAINARDAMPNGGILTIETANVILDKDYAADYLEVEPGEYVMMAVSDTGRGMPQDVLARVFEPFFTTKEEGHGTGLGLSQVYGWVKQSGGHIKIYSELAHGTTIKLYLPRAVGELGRNKELAPTETEAGGNETVLVVEDNPHVRMTVKRQLTDLGYSTIEATDGEAAQAMIEAGAEFDLLLTDVVMPGGISGYELASQAERSRPGIKVLFTSGYTELAANELQKSRKGPLISKPYAKRDLGRAIRSVLDGATWEG
jgi:PAS domain S-box-containing protein